MQKRARAVETQKMRRTMKARVKVVDPVRESFSMSTTLAYLRLSLLWVGVISLDVLVGFRFELLWPFWLVCRAGYESFQKSNNHAATLANQNTAKFSVFFVCITATSDLLCYLLIPAPLLIFLASTYVWVSLIWATHGGFLKTWSLVQAEKTQGIPVLLLGVCVIVFEFLCRKRCDFNLFLAEGGSFLPYAGDRGCQHLQGLSPNLPKSMNSLFGAHSIGYPLVLISFGLRYYVREFLVRRGRVEVSRKNEEYCRLLTEALPAIYEGPRDYSIKTQIVDDECESLMNGLDLQPIMMTPNPSSSSIQSNGTSSKRSAAKHSNGLRQRTRKNDQQHNPPQRLPCARKPDDEDSDVSEEWSSSNSGGGGVWFIRITWDLLYWLGSLFASSPPPVEQEADEYEDEDSQQDNGDYKKNNLRNGDAAKMRVTTAPTSTRKGRGRGKEKGIAAQAEREKAAQVHKGGETRDSSRETSISNSNSRSISLNLEIDRLKSEIMHLRTAEQDLRLQLSGSRNSESLARQELNQIKNTLERLETKNSSMEKQRDADRSTITVLERKYAELMNKKNDVERELMAERKARKEDGGKRSDTVEQHRERERQLEQEMEKIRNESSQREERLVKLEQELQELRQYKESNDNDLTEKDCELELLRERIRTLEESLQSENKLKQDLFRALGDARTQNAHLEGKLRTHDSSISINVNHNSMSTEKLSPSSTTSPLPPPSYTAAMQQKADSNKIGPYLYTALQQHHCSPTGEHVLFDQPSVSPIPSCAMMPQDVLNARMGKFGAPANPARIN